MIGGKFVVNLLHKDTIMKKVTKKTEKTIEQDFNEIEVITSAMSDKKAKGIISLDLRNIGTAIADWFIICNADSTTNVLAICDNIDDEMEKKCKRSVIRQQGRENAFWIIMDYGDIVVHIFQTEQRMFYRLEDLWADAIKTTYEE